MEVEVKRELVKRFGWDSQSRCFPDTDGSKGTANRIYAISDLEGPAHF